MKKISKEDWLKAGMHALSKDGEEAIRIDKLCTVLNVSKGSFYHHFKNIEDYVAALMTFWEKSMTENIIEATESEADFSGKMEKLNNIAMNEDHLLEVRLRAWGLRNGQVQEQIEHVDGRRIQYLKNLYLENRNTQEDAEYLSKLEYASFVGMQHLFRNLPEKEKMRLSQLFHQLLKTKEK